ncbi:MAG: hypothetical protein NPIRA02_25850 [Nitrospirales bacterium]|nr:MAG: hypothetical protein NPIRA02_25850 [Nitrospirales bacterium]
MVDLAGGCLLGRLEGLPVVALLVVGDDRNLALLDHRVLQA